ncbi:MAG: hypothetical protein QXG05_04395 [Nitrososphaerota archaeon]
MEVLFKYLTLARMNMRRRGLLFFSSFFERISNNIRERQKRDVEFLNSLSISKMNDILWPLYVSFVCLSFLDVYSTILALSSSTSFHELNPIAGPLFGMQLPGLLLALTFKYLPMIPLFYAVFIRDKPEHHLQVVIVKFSALIALAAADIFLASILLTNNIPLLLKWALANS